MSEEGMNYGMLGEDTQKPAEKLAKYTGIVDWTYLKPHYESKVLYFVDPELKLEEVGEAITRDDREQVQAWLEARDLVQIEALHAQQWERELAVISEESDTEGKKEASVRPSRFKALVVSPFVLCQLL